MERRQQESGIHKSKGNTVAGWFARFIGSFTALALLVMLVPVAGIPASAALTSRFPAGFENARVPDIDLGGYLYFNQSSPINLAAGILPALAEPASLESFSVYLGTDIQHLGGEVNLDSESNAKNIADQIKQGENWWSLAQGSSVYLGYGSQDWLSTLQNGVSRQLLVKEKYPTIWDSFSYLPVQPPTAPVATGFLNIEGPLLSSLTQNGSNLGGISGVLGAAKIDHIVLGLYGNTPLDISSTFNADTINQYSILIAGYSSYPSLLFSIFFDKLLQDGGATQSTVNQTVFYTFETNGSAVLVSRRGSVIYAAMATQKDVAEQLLLGAVNPTPELPPTVESSDGVATVSIPDGTIGKTKTGEPLSNITIEPVPAPPAPPDGSKMLGIAYDFGPDGATFSQPISMTLKYNTASIPSGVAEKDLVVAFYDVTTRSWVVLSGAVVDPVAGTVTAPVSHFSKYAVITRPPLASPASTGLNQLIIIGIIAVVILAIGVGVRLIPRRAAG